ncbi:MAG: hypothetical protein PHT44_04420 [Candidatus Portnoybacteria bacterium]|nr:hypothetical protein [Candidatus Portnoybacteria bacterium]MDD4983154.1 hypothetical protein [Candidatus Portnoybacteria bacterium]
MTISRFSQKNALFLTAIVTVSLLSGYFCFPPQTARAVNAPGCQDANQDGRAIISGAADSGAVAPCCLQKKDNNHSGAPTFNNLSSKLAIQQNVCAGSIDTNAFSGQSTFQEVYTPPPQADLLASVIKIE